MSRGTTGLDLPGVGDELDRGGVRGQTISEPNYKLWFTTAFLLSFFTLAFVLVNDLSLVSRCFLFWKWRTILFSFLLPFVSFCCMHLYFMFTAVSYQMFFH